jgi:hypothetical protein
MRKARAESFDKRVITWDKLALSGDQAVYVVTDSQGEYEKKWSNYVQSVADYLRRLDEIWLSEYHRIGAE